MKRSKKTNRIEEFCSRHQGTIALLELFFAVVGIIIGGSLVINSNSFQAGIINRIEHQENNYSETVIGNAPEYTDYLSRAKSGDVYAQMRMAKLFKEANNYADSIYWYINAAEQESKYQAIAYNNLGWLYANGYGLNEYPKISSYRYDKAFTMFYNASQLGLTVGMDNMVQLALLPGYTPPQDIDENSKRIIESKTASDDQEKQVVKSMVLHSNVYRGPIASFDNYHGKFAGTATLPSSNGLYDTVYMYSGVVYNTDGQIENCVYIDVFDNVD